jgi:hypothetical protein
MLDLQPDHLWVMFHARIGVVPPGGVNRAAFAARESEAAVESAAPPSVLGRELLFQLV